MVIQILDRRVVDDDAAGWNKLSDVLWGDR